MGGRSRRTEIIPLYAVPAIKRKNSVVRKGNGSNGPSNEETRLVAVTTHTLRLGTGTREAHRTHDRETTVVSPGLTDTSETCTSSRLSTLWWSSFFDTSGVGEVRTTTCRLPFTGDPKHPRRRVWVVSPGNPVSPRPDSGKENLRRQFVSTPPRDVPEDLHPSPAHSSLRLGH